MGSRFIQVYTVSECLRMSTYKRDNWKVNAECNRGKGIIFAIVPLEWPTFLIY
jgi:hypothetical protein